MKIRLMARQDCAAVAQMIRELAEFHGDTSDVNESQVRQLCLGSTSWFTTLVAETSEGLCGYAALFPLGQLQCAGKGMELHHLFVRGTCQGQGVGRMLVAAAEEEARRNGASFLMVGTDDNNHRAHAFYEGLGMERKSLRGPRFSKPL